MGKDELARAVIQRSVVVSKEKEDNEVRVPSHGGWPDLLI